MCIRDRGGSVSIDKQVNKLVRPSSQVPQLAEQDSKKKLNARHDSMITFTNNQSWQVLTPDRNYNKSMVQLIKTNSPKMQQQQSQLLTKPGVSDLVIQNRQRSAKASMVSSPFSKINEKMGQADL
eukprot:TRINITY_DN2900_c0_g2_i2.p5 TRINITY_DN2900_c0_g2~~TRINITY_DN2900_c0_g2_i2.p5  ORF type:complete len:125 (-),score=8.03 TRINITY_DN2900_c0_g2_i2:789-1163(-)